MYNSKIWDELFKDGEDLFNRFNENVDFGRYEKDCKDDGCKSYYHFMSDRYENGKRVEHNEKIINDGKIVKDEHLNIEDKKEEKKAVDSETIKAKNNEIEKLKKENERLRKENSDLMGKILKIKSLFN